MKEKQRIKEQLKAHQLAQKKKEEEELQIKKKEKQFYMKFEDWYEKEQSELNKNKQEWI